MRRLHRCASQRASVPKDDFLSALCEVLCTVLDALTTERLQRTLDEAAQASPERTHSQLGGWWCGPPVDPLQHQDGGVVGGIFPSHAPFCHPRLDGEVRQRHLPRGRRHRRHFTIPRVRAPGAPRATPTADGALRWKWKASPNWECRRALLQIQWGAPLLYPPSDMRTGVCSSYILALRLPEHVPSHSGN